MGPAPRPSRDPGGTHSLNQSIIELTTDTVFRPILCDTIMQLLNAYSKPLLLYGIEAVNPNRRLVNDLSNAWNSVIRKVFNIKYDYVDYVTAMIEDKSLSEVIKYRCINFRKAIPLTGNSVLCNVCF